MLWYLFCKDPSNTEIHTRSLHGALPSSFSPDGARILTVSGNRLTVLDAETQTELIAVRFDGIRHFTSAAFSPDGRRVAVSDVDNAIRVWDADIWSLSALTTRAAAGDASAMLALADIYEENDRTPFFTVDAPLEKALDQLERAAALNAPDAIRRLNAFKAKHYLPLYIGIAARAERDRDPARLILAADNLAAFYRRQPQRPDILSRALVALRHASTIGSRDADDQLQRLADEFPAARIEIYGHGPGASFETPDGFRWRAQSGYWLPENGAILGKSIGEAYLVSERRHPDRFRIRIETASWEGSEISIWFCGSMENTERDGYFIGVNQEMAKLQKQTRNVAFSDRVRIEPRRQYALTVEKNDGWIRGYLDDAAEPFIEWQDPEPLTGEGHRHWGYYIFLGSISTSNWQITELE